MTNNEARQNYLATIETSKAYLLYHSTKAMVLIDQEDKERALHTAHTHARNIADMVEDYKGIPADDKEHIQVRTHENLQ